MIFLIFNIIEIEVSNQSIFMFLNVFINHIKSYTVKQKKCSK